MKVTIIDYGAGNIQSIRFAIERLGLQARLSYSAGEILDSDRVIFPGVGEASSAMAKLRESGLDGLIPKLTQPVLGICLGMQLMCRATEEGNTRGLDIFNTQVVRFKDNVKVPQIGWNEITSLRSPLFETISEGAHIYMVHSYYAPLCEETIAQCEYGIPYSAALQKDNFYGTQFHPEKSGDIGERILNNFLRES